MSAPPLPPPAALPPAAPTAPAARVLALDILRGFAVLGILVMNIQEFAMPEAAYFNPTVFGDLDGANYWVWALSHLFADHKFMNIFAMLFGAGIVLFTSHLEARGLPPGPLQARRAFWLLVIGLAHAHLVWSGDILVAYALTTFVVTRWRHAPPRRLVLLGIVMLLVPAALMLLFGALVPHMPAAQRQGLIADWQPTAAALQAEIDAYRGGWLQQLPTRSASARNLEVFGFLFWSFWRSAGLMLFGMALFRSGWLVGQRSTAAYFLLASFGLGLGLPIVGAGVATNIAHDWSFAWARFGFGYMFNYWGSILVSLGYICGVQLFVRAGRMRWLRTALAAVGRTALSNYLLQSLLATFVFYGHGLGLFGAVERTGQILIVFAVWVVQLVVSPWWLQRHRFGPAEWLWRSLTYGRRQPWRADPATPAVL